jgi:hypothetical protein
VLATVIYGVTAIATGIQLWWLMSWAIWGARIKPVEYMALLGPVILFVAAMLGLRRNRSLRLIALAGLLLLWPFYASLMYETWLNPGVTFTFRAAIVGSLPASMLLVATLFVGVQLHDPNLT